MLDFIFTYTWLAIVIIGYTIWTFVSIEDIKNNPNKIKPSSESWIIVTVIVIFSIIIILFGASFMYWLYGCIG